MKKNIKKKKINKIIKYKSGFSYFYVETLNGLKEDLNLEGKSKVNR